MTIQGKEGDKEKLVASSRVKTSKPSFQPKK